MKHFLSMMSTPGEDLCAMLRGAHGLRERPRALLAGKTLCCLFEKPSLRTRVSFEQAMRRLGGEVMSMLQSEVGVGSRESPQDVSRVLSRMVDVIMARVLSHRTLELMAETSEVPVINGLSDLAHPAQALADMLTLMDEFSPGDPEGLVGRTVVFVGDGNNVARSLAVACGKLGVRFVICSPARYELAPSWIERARAHVPGIVIELEADPIRAVRGADAVYCDTFVSMGQEHERTDRLDAFAAYQVNEGLLERAPGHAIVMHCLPASRGIEISDGAMDGPRSRVFAQAENRMWGQMGLLAHLLAPGA